MAPGNSIGSLTTTGTVTWNSNNAWQVELGTSGPSLSSPGTSDRLNILGDFVASDGSSWSFDFLGTGSVGFYKIVDWAGSTDFSASQFVATNLTGGLSGSFIVDHSSSALYLQVVPEPSSAAMLLGVVGLLTLRRRCA